MKIVLISGFSQTAEVLSDLSSSLSKYGETQTFSAAYFAEKELEGGLDYKASIEKALEGFEEIVLIGWSLGGKICLDIAPSLGSRLKGLVLMSSTACFLEKTDNPNGVPLASYKALCRGIENNKQQTLAGFMSSMFHGENNSESLFLDNSLSVETSLLLNNLGYLKQDMRENLGLIKIPCLIIHGNDDKVIAVSHAAYSNKMIESSVLEVYAECGHVPFLEYPDRVESDILNFFKKGGCLNV